MVADLLLWTCPITQQHPGNPDHQGWAGGRHYLPATGGSEGTKSQGGPQERGSSSLLSRDSCLRTVAGAVSRETGCGMAGLS